MNTSIRLATPDDAPSLLTLYAPIVLETHVSFEETPPSEPEMRSRIADGLAQGYPWLVFEANERVGAYAYASRHRARPAYRWSVESSIYVSEALRGRGIGKALYGALLPLLASQGYHGVFAGIALPNRASVALHRAVGFRELGRFERVGYKAGAWRDTLWMQLHLRDSTSPPGELRSVEEVVRSRTR